MKKYLIILFFVGNSFCFTDSTGFKLAFLYKELESSVRRIFDSLPKDRMSSLLNEIQQGGPRLKPVEKPKGEQQKDGKDKKQQNLFNSGLVDKAKEGNKKPTSDPDDDTDWESPKPVETKEPDLSIVLPRLEFDNKGTAQAIDSSIQDYLSKLEAYLKKITDNKKQISSNDKYDISADEQKVDKIVDDKFSKDKKTAFHNELKKLRKEYENLGLKEYKPEISAKPADPKPKLPAKPADQKPKLPPKPADPKPANPQSSVIRKETFSDGGKLFDQIRDSSPTHLKPASKDLAEIASIDFSKLEPNRVVEKLGEIKNSMDQLSFEQLFDIATHEYRSDIKDVLTDDDELWKNLKGIAKSKIDEFINSSDAAKSQRAWLLKKYFV